MKTKSEQLKIEVEYKTKHLELTQDENFWVFDSWAVWINGERFDYKTGIGHRARRVVIGAGQDRKEFERLKSMNPRKDRKNIEMFIQRFEGISKPVAPSLDDVLYSLITDADALSMYFQEWADCFGYDQDSRKALETYEACRKNGEKLISAGITPDEKTREAFQDY